MIFFLEVLGINLYTNQQNNESLIMACSSECKKGGRVSVLTALITEVGKCDGSILLSL